MKKLLVLILVVSLFLIGCDSGRESVSSNNIDSFLESSLFKGKSVSVNQEDDIFLTDYTLSANDFLSWLDKNIPYYSTSDLVSDEADIADYTVMIYDFLHNSDALTYSIKRGGKLFSITAQVTTDNEWESYIDNFDNMSDTVIIDRENKAIYNKKENWGNGLIWECFYLHRGNILFIVGADKDELNNDNFLEYTKSVLNLLDGFNETVQKVTKDTLPVMENTLSAEETVKFIKSSISRTKSGIKIPFNSFNIEYVTNNSVLDTSVAKIQYKCEFESNVSRLDSFATVTVYDRILTESSYYYTEGSGNHILVLFRGNCKYVFKAPSDDEVYLIASIWRPVYDSGKILTQTGYDSLDVFEAPYDRCSLDIEDELRSLGLKEDLSDTIIVK